MRDQLFLNLLRTSLVTGIFTVALALAAPLWNRRFTALWRKRLWCVLAAVLVLGAFLRLPETAPKAVEITVPERRVVITPPAAAPGDAGAAVPQAPRVRVVDPETLPAGDTAGTAPADREALGGAYADRAALPGIPLLTLAELVWACGAAVFFLWQLGGGLLFRRRVRRWGRPAAAAALLEAYSRACRDTGRRGRLPRLLVCPGVGSPQLRGLLRPRLLLPAEDYTAVEIRYILRHELTHWQSRDLWWKALALLANALHWFNPAAWLLSREMGRDMERACDERVMEGADSTARRAYGEVLLTSLHRQRQAGLSTCFYGGKRAVKERLVNILTTVPRRRGTALALACAALLVCAVPLVACTRKAEKSAGTAPVPEGYALAATLPLEGLAAVGEDAEYGYLHGGPSVRMPEVLEPRWMGEVRPLLTLSDGREVVFYEDLRTDAGPRPGWAIRDGDTCTGFAWAETGGPEGAIVTEKRGVLGHDGFCIQPAEENLSPAYYYCFKDGAGPYLMAPCPALAGASVTEEDLDGDGMKELIWYCGAGGCCFYLWRDGALYSGSVGDLALANGMDWSVTETSPWEITDGLLPIWVRTEDFLSRDGLVRFTAEGVEVWLQSAAGEADEAVTAMAGAYIREVIDRDFGTDITDSRITGLRQAAAAPDPGGSGQIELWVLSYALKPRAPETLEATPWVDYLVENTVYQEQWLVFGEEGVSYLQPVLAVWRDAYGNCVLEDTVTAGGVDEEMMGSYSFCASEYLYRKLGVRAQTAAFHTLEQGETAYELLYAPCFSMYIPEDWEVTGLEQEPPEGATRWCAGFWHSLEDWDTGVVIYHVDSGPEAEDLGTNLLFAAAADAGRELDFVSRYYSNLDTSGGPVRQYAGVTADGLILRACAVGDGDGGAWGVVTRCPRDGAEDLVQAAAITFLPKTPAFPTPAAAAYGLTGDDAAIYNAVARTLSETERMREGDYLFTVEKSLCLPCVTVLDSYPAENGGTVYLCNWWDYIYYGVAPDSAAVELGPGYLTRSDRRMVRFTISADGVCTGMEEMGGAIAHQPRAPQLRPLVSGTAGELLDAYLRYYFPEAASGGPYAEVYDLTQRGGYTVSGETDGEAPTVLLWEFKTNSTRIRVKNSGTGEVTVYLYDPDSSDEFAPILEFTLAPGKRKEFTNLTAARTYRLGISAETAADFALTVSD